MNRTEKDPAQGKWRYLYCVAEGPEALELRFTGVQGKQVYGIGFRDLVAFVHDCEGGPGEIKDPELARRLLLAHQGVVDGVFARLGSVLPVGFGNIISPGEGKGADELVSGWLGKNYEAFKGKLGRVRGKAEYGVQIFMDCEAAAAGLKETVPELKRLGEEAEDTASPGVAFLRKESFKEVLSHEIGSMAGKCFNAFYKRISGLGGEFKVERTGPEGGKRMIMNLSCLLSEAQAKEMGELLEDISSYSFVSLRFTGPWPPYSFV
ncbi:MAG: GvpL/GvpF family gas vesicle protein [Deltaproteobacteria bacterium]|nr:GvpL/GvpF family gas vesicle protein [Deltaproteobacteria bacterium]